MYSYTVVSGNQRKKITFDGKCHKKSSECLRCCIRPKNGTKTKFHLFCLPSKSYSFFVCCVIGIINVMINDY